MRCTGCRAASRGARNPISGSCERSAIVYQSHRIWQSNGSAAHVGPVRGTTGWRAVALSDCPSQTGSPSAAPGCFCSQITANAVIARSEIRGLIHVRDPNHGEAPGRSVQSRIFHLFHVFYQVQIRLSSPHVEEPWARPNDIDNSARIGPCSRDNSRIIGTADDNIFLLKHQ
jgi:hypothetical protein